VAYRRLLDGTTALIAGRLFVYLDHKEFCVAYQSGLLIFSPFLGLACEQFGKQGTRWAIEKKFSIKTTEYFLLDCLVCRDGVWYKRRGTR